MSNPKQKPINVLHVSSPLSWRGGEQQLYYLHSGLKDRGYNSAVFCPNESILASRLTIDERVLYNKRSGFDIGAAYSLAKFCRMHKTNIIHAHDAHAHTTAVLSSLFFGNKVPIFLSRRVDFEIGKSWFSRFKYNYKQIKVIACVSDLIRSMVEPKIHAEHVKVLTIHSGVDLTRFENVTPINLREELHVDKNEKLVANFSALADHKDYFTFLKTAKEVCKNRNDVTFLIFGKGELEEELKNYSNTLGITDKVIFAGFRKDLPSVYPNIDVLLFTSKTEGLGTTILDAFASKTPVVATRAGGIPEMVIHNQTGLLAEVGDANSLAEHVELMLDNRDFANTIRSQALLKAQEFTVSSMIDKTENSYKKVLNI